MITKEMVKNSMEAKWRKDQIKMHGVIALFIFIFIFFGVMVSVMEHGDFLIALEVFGIVVLIYAVLFGVFVLYYAYKFFCLFKDLEQYEVYEVFLDKPSTSYLYRGAIYYTVSFETMKGEKITQDTKPFWSSGIFASFQLEDYNGKKIKIAYNANTETMITLGL